MKRTYQISKAVAMKRFQKLVEDRNPAVQLVFPLADMLGLMRAGLGNLVIELGRQFFEEVMKTEALEVAGATGLRQPNRKLNRWGRAKGFCVVNGQKIPLTRPRLRNRNGREESLGSYETIQRASLMGETVWKRMMHGLSTRSYSQIVKEFTDSYGIEKSTVSDHFVEFSRNKLEEFVNRPLDSYRLCVIFLDGTWFSDQNLLVAMGLTCEGYKIALGMRQISQKTPP